jgi:AraC-like DNA-binding protein
MVRSSQPGGVPVESATTEPGILHPGLSAQRFDYRRHEPDPRLAPFVENFWTITWDLRGQPPFIAQVLPYPSVNATVTNEQADVTGVTRSRYDRRLVDEGYVVGARFRPGCFRPFLNTSVSRLTDRHRPIAEVLGRDTTALMAGVAATSDREERVSLLTDFLLQQEALPDPLSESLAELVEVIATRTDITRVAQVAELAQTGVRRLQRLFGEYVGAGPKWVIARCRLQDAAARAAAQRPVDWAGLAAELGFADQAHLTRAFARTIGTPPAAYAAHVKSFTR